MKKILIFVFVLMLMIFSMINATPIKTIKVVLDDSYPPYSFLDSSGKLKGICVDLWKKWEDVTGVNVKLLAVNWAQAIPMVEKGQADVVDEIFYTKQRAKKLDFTESYDEVKTVVFFDKNLSGITNDLSTLKGFRIGVKSGDYDATYLSEHGIKDLLYYPSYSDLVKAAVEKKIHIFVMDEPAGFYYLSKYASLNDFKYSQALYTSKIYRAVKKGNSSLVNLINDGFSKIPSSYVKSVMKKWKGNAFYSLRSWQTIEILIIVGIAMASLMVIFVIWNRTLSFMIKKRVEEIKQEAEKTEKAEKEVARISDQLRQVTEHLYKLNERTTKMIRLISELSPFSNEKEFAKDVLNVALQFVPEAQGGSISIVDGEKWKYLAVSDNYDEKRLMKLDLKAEWMYKVDEVKVVDYLLEKDKMTLPTELVEELVKATGNEIIKSLVVPIQINGKYAGNIFLDAFKDVEFSEESKYMMETFGKLVSSFFTIKRVNSLELAHQRELLRKIVDLLEATDPRTRGHSERVAALAENIGKVLSLDEEKMEDLKWCSLFHDIGFVGIPHYIHAKTVLAEDELDIKKTHTLIGELIIETSTLPQRYKAVIRSHHENFDGSGYPDGLKGEEIPLLSRIIAVANEFDELVNFKKMNANEAIEEIKKASGTKFDPKVVEASLNVFEDFAAKLRKK